MATTFAPNCSLLVANAGGNVQNLPDMRASGKEREWVEKIPLGGASQVIADQVMVARLPFGAVPLVIELNSSVSLGVVTISFGDKNNTSRFVAAGTFTAVDTPSPKMGAIVAGVPLTTCYDYAGTSNTKYEDILMTIGTSSISAVGTLMICTKYLDYSS